MKPVRHRKREVPAGERSRTFTQWAQYFKDGVHKVYTLLSRRVHSYDDVLCSQNGGEGARTPVSRWQTKDSGHIARHANTHAFLAEYGHHLQTRP